MQLATDYIDARAGAPRRRRRRYEVKRIGFGTQIFENLVIGDPRRPDLVARAGRGRRSCSASPAPSVGLITARGVRMRGRIENGRLTLGQIDRLLPPPSGEPFRLPDQRIDVEDAALALARRPARSRWRCAGRGNLSDGFRGGLALVSRELRLGDCMLDRPGRALRRAGRPIAGRGCAARRRCARLRLRRRPRRRAAAVRRCEALLAPGLDRWRGTTAMRVAELRRGRPAPRRLPGPAHLRRQRRRDRAARLDLAPARPRRSGVRAARHRASTAAIALSPRRRRSRAGGQARRGRA